MREPCLHGIKTTNYMITSQCRALFVLSLVKVDKYNYATHIYRLHCVCLCPQTNQRMSLARLQHEVEELRRRIEELKVKLTAEMKVCLSLLFSLLIFS